MAIHRLVLIHTVPPLVEVFTRLAARELPGVALLHVLDEPLLERVRQKGMLDGEDVERLAGHVREAALVGADAVLVTCSTVSPAVDGARAQALFPVLKIDEAMVAEAVRLAALSGGRIGVIATNPTTLAPTCALIEAHAAQAGIQVTTETYMVEGALGYLLKGNTDYHDVLVERAVLEISGRVDVVVLAQATMARVLDAHLHNTVHVPVLSSPHLALRQVAALLKDASETTDLQ